MQIIKNKTNIDFLSPLRRKIALSLSALFVTLSLISLATEGLEFGIDFTGGVLLEIGYEQAADLEAIRADLAADTPLAVTGFIRDHGIWYNWFGWHYVLSQMLAVFLFSRFWRRAAPPWGVPATPPCGPATG